MANIKEVAKRAGVSISTVSRALTGNIPVSDEAKFRVLDAVKELNYQPNTFAQGLRGARIKTIGLVIPNIRNLVFPAAIRGIEDTAKENGYNVVLCNTDEDVEKEQSYIESLRRRFIDGFIFTTARLGHEYLLQLPEQGIPIVFMIRQMGSSINTVVLDNEGGAWEATRYLLSRNLKKIAVISGFTDIQLYKHRVAGFQRAMQEAGVPVDPEIIIHNVHGWDDGYQAMSSLLKKGIQPEAVFAMSDPKAIGVIRAIKDFGLRVPEDISVMGFDDLDISPLIDPPLTTVAQPFYEMGVKACSRLIEMIEESGAAEPGVEVLPAHLVIRKSVV